MQKRRKTILLEENEEEEWDSALTPDKRIKSEEDNNNEFEDYENAGDWTIRDDYIISPEESCIINDDDLPGNYPGYLNNFGSHSLAKQFSQLNCAASNHPSNARLMIQRVSVKKGDSLKELTGHINMLELTLVTRNPETPLSVHTNRRSDWAKKLLPQFVKATTMAKDSKEIEECIIEIGHHWKELLMSKDLKENFKEYPIEHLETLQELAKKHYIIELF